MIRRVWYTVAMVDRLFADPALAALYDAICGRERREDFRFYLSLIMSANTVLDVGCGTGALLHLAREFGHSGRLTGLDPAHGMLEQARKRSDVEWILGDLRSVSWNQEFDLVVMAGHAFQVLLDDDEVRAALAVIRAALTDGGCFAFETRNPLAREWERWTPDRVAEVRAPSGSVVRMRREVDRPSEGGIIRFTHTFTSDRWDGPQVSRSSLRFLDASSLSSFLSGAGMTIERQLGSWDGAPLGETSSEIITIARRT